VKAARLTVRSGSHNLKEQPCFLPSNLNPSAAPVLEDYPVARRDLTNPVLENHYLEREAKVPTNLPKYERKPCKDFCGVLAIIGQDQDGNRIAKRLWCGREWCEKCRDHSHNRRIARWLPRVQQIESLACWTVTYPKEVRLFVRTKKSLRSQKGKLIRALKELGYSRGMIRWHFFGDQSTEYHPHQNAIVDGGYLSPGELQRQKDFIRRKLLKRFMANELGKDLEIHYQYTTSPKKIYHKLKYITRATFLDQSWDELLAAKIYGLRNNNTWGKWDQSQKWQLRHRNRSIAIMAKVEQGLHPISGKPLTWKKQLVPFALILSQDPTEIAPGYYLLPPIRQPPKNRGSPFPYLQPYLPNDRLTPKQRLRLWQLHQAEL